MSNSNNKHKDGYNNCELSNFNTNSNLIVTVKIPDTIKIFNTFFNITKKFKFKKIDNLIISRKINYIELNKLSIIYKLFKKFYDIILSNTCLKKIKNSNKLIKFIISPQFAKLTIDYFIQYYNCIISNNTTNIFNFKDDKYKLNYVLKKFKLYKEFEVVDDVFDYNNNLAFSYFHAGTIILPRCSYENSMKRFKLVYNYNKTYTENVNNCDIYDDYISVEEIEIIFFHELIHVFCDIIELKTLLCDIDKMNNYDFNFCEENLVNICSQELYSFLNYFEIKT